MDTPTRRFRAGETIEDFCRACKADRLHTVVVADTDGRPMRVACGYCHSEHNFRGGSRQNAAGGGPVAAPGVTAPARASRPRPVREPFPVVSDRELDGGVAGADAHLERLLRRVIREEAGVSAVVPADRWRGGSLVLRPGVPGLQEKVWPVETFFHKVVMLRNRLRTLEQVVNAADLPEDAKAKVQSYVTACYGSLTSFNVLFADEDDQFKGSGD